ncbi:MAG: hypothetical protein ABI831_11960 [Betaproteobacteria bacterium]
MRYVIMLALAAVVSGCASVGDFQRSAIDSEKVARIESAARSVGVQVYWVNYPTRSSAAIN